jgi:tetratricopeptide (TPR) repeat protein
MGTLVNNYVFKAIENYPYDLEETMEALNYALSYDENNTMALTLLGRVYAEKLFKYEDALVYFKKALAENIQAYEVYLPYIDTLLWNEDYQEAKKFVNFAFTVKGVDKGTLYLKKAIIFEYLKKYEKALKCIKLAKEHTYNNEFMCVIDQEKDRIKNKMPKKKKCTKKKEKGKKK